MKMTPQKKRKTWPIVLIIIGCVLLLLTGAAIFLVKHYTGGIEKINTKPEDLGITTGDKTSAPEPEDDITNIVFLGIDREENRSDVMIILSINKTRDRIKVISILRDTKAQVDGYEYLTKIGRAYKAGGSVNAVKAINTNFHTEFSRFISMNFEDVEAIVDYLGGVDIELTAEEAKLVNSGAKTLDYYGQDAEEGVNHLNGAQAVAFSRIRKIDSEYHRASRQQMVIEAMFKNAKSMSASEYPELIRLITDSLETNMSYSDLLEFTSLDIKYAEISEYTIPDEKYEEDLWGGWEDGPYEYQWLWIYDLDKAGERLMNIIYGE